MTYKKHSPKILYSINIPMLIIAVVFGAAFIKINYDKKVRVIQAEQVAGEQAVQDGIYKQTITEGGKTAEITKEVRDGKIYINIKTYDQNGTLLNSKDTVKDLTTPTKSQTQPKVQEPVESVEVQKPIGNTQTNTENNTETEASVETTTQNKIQNINRFQIVGEMYTTNSNFPVTVNEETGNIIVETPNKMIELNTPPEVVAQKAERAGTVSNITSVRIESPDNENVNIVLNGSRKISIFGVVNFDLPATAVYDAETGTLKNASLDAVSRITKVFNN